MKVRQVQFWNWLQEHSARLQATEASDHSTLMDELDDRFKASFPNLAWEITQQPSCPWTFIVSARGKLDLFPQVRAVVAEAPLLPNWKVIPFRQPGELEASITMNGVTLRSQDVWCEVVPRGGQINVTLLIRRLEGPVMDTLLGSALVLLDNAIGEYASATKIAELNYGSQPFGVIETDSRFPLARLRDYLTLLEHSDSGTIRH